MFEVCFEDQLINIYVKKSKELTELFDVTTKTQSKFFSNGLLEFKIIMFYLIDELLTSSRIRSSRSRITGSTCSTDRIHAESCTPSCCCSKVTILDCNSDVRTKNTTQTPMQRTNTARQTVTQDEQFFHSGSLRGCGFRAQREFPSPGLPAAAHV